MGGASSKMDVQNTIRSSIDNVMKSRVLGDLDVSCNNRQLVEDVKNCTIKFDEQLCNVIGVSNFTSTTSFDASISQSILNNIQATVEAAVEGLNLGNFSDSSMYMNNLVETSMRSTQDFLTSCTRDVSAVNEQTVSKCEDSNIEFAKQQADAELIGDCVANQIGTFQASQNVTNLMDLKASATTKGVDLWAMVMLFAVLILGVVFAVPMFIYGIRYAINAKVGKDTPEARAQLKREKARLYFIVFIIVIMLLVAAFWWPGLGAIYLRIAPWNYFDILRGKNCGQNPDDPDCVRGVCNLGKSIDPELFVNQFMWYDPYCLSKSLGTDKVPAYCENMKHYKYCGIFAESPYNCTDPKFVQEKEKFIKMLELCSQDAIVGAPFEKCTSEHIAFAMFSDNEAAYGSCKKCVGTSDEEKLLANPRENYGLWSKEEASCASGISKTAYYGPPCEPGDTDCRESMDDLKAVSPNECDDEAYQQRKKKFSKAWKACQEIQQNSLINEEKLGYMPLLSMQCPPNAFDYFSKCDARTKECSYNPSGCKCDSRGQNCDCSSVATETIAACKNDIFGCCEEQEGGVYTCRDPALQLDYNLWKNADRDCQAKQEAYNTLNPWAWIGTIIFYFVCIGIIFYVLTQYPSTAEDFTRAAQVKQVKSSWYVGLMVFFLIMFVASGWPIGILALVYNGGNYSFYGEDAREDMDNFDERKAMICGFTGLAISIIGMLWLVNKSRYKTETVQAAKPVKS